MLEPNNSFIDVYDNLFTLDERMRWFKYCTSSYFNVNGVDGLGYTGVREQQIYSTLSNKDIITLGLLQTPALQDVIKKYKLESLKLYQARINLSTPVEKNYPHGDNCKVTLLYYANIDWDITWGGQTLFFNKGISQVDFTSLYVPGRLIVFSGHTPHMIITPTVFSELHRYSIVFQFKEEINVS